MESPVVLDKPTEYHGSKGDERGFPFDEEDASGAWSSLAARHPDIAARLRQRPATWARKRRPSSQDPTEDFGDSFGGFDRFPFDDIPPEFREHFPAHWGRRFEEPPAPAPAPANPAPAPAQAPAPPQQTSPKQPEQPDAPTPLPQYGLRNTVDLGQRNPPVDAEERAQRSVSAPPDARPPMSHEPPPEGAPPGPPGNVRHIPIFVEGRDEPVVNRTDPAAHFAAPPDREQYFADDPPAFHHPPNFSRAFGTPFNKGFRQGPQPFVQQKVYPQTGFARGASPQRSNSPKPPHTEEFRHEPAQRAQPPPPQAPPQHQAPPHQAPKQQAPKQQAPQHQAPQQQAPPPAPSPPPRPQTTPADPITLILGIQTDVLNLMSEVENFTGTKKDKRYVYLDEMLTRNLIKLDNIETDGKENIRQARKEAIKCIQKCIAVLEAKAEGRTAAAAPPAPASEPAPENGEVEMKEDAKEEPMAISQDEPAQAPQQPPEQPPQAPQQPPQDQQQPPEQAPQQPSQPEPEPEEAAPPAADTRPVENRAVLVEKPEQKNEPEKPTPKKSTKGAKKRDKSKDKTAKESTKEDASEKKLESNVDDKGDKPAPMEVDGAASQ